MKPLFLYWMIGCLIVGGGSAAHAKRCPDDAPISGYDALVSIAIWPAGFFYVLSSDLALPACKMLPRGT